MTIEPTNDPLHVAQLHVWTNWESIARDRFGVNTLTVLAVDTVWRRAAANIDGKTVEAANTDPDHVVTIRVLKTNVRILAQVTDRHHFVLMSIEPHPFTVESMW